MKIFHNSTLNPVFSERDILQDLSFLMLRDQLDKELEEVNGIELEEITKWRSKKPMTDKFVPSKELQEKLIL